MRNFLRKFTRRRRYAESTVDIARLDFSVDQVSEMDISGWAWRPEHPDERLTIELIEGDVVKAQARADQPRTDLALAGKADGTCAFFIVPPNSLRTEGSHQIGLRVLGEPSPFYRSVIIMGAAPAMLQEAKLDFCIDLASETVFEGWAWKPGSPLDRVSIEIVENDVVLASGYADQLRDDLRLAGKGEGDCGFSLQVPETVKDGRSHQLELRLRGDVSSFWVSPPRVFGTVSVDVTCFTLDQIEGRAWVTEQPDTSVDIEITLNDECLLSISTLDDHTFSCTPSAALAKWFCPKRDGNGNETATLQLFCNGRPIRSEAFPVMRSASGLFAVVLETVSSMLVRGLVVWGAEFPIPDAIVLSVDGVERDFAEVDPVGRFAFSLPRLRLADRVHLLSITASGTREAIKVVLPFARYSAHLDVIDGLIVGHVRDHWDESHRLLMDLVLDGSPVGNLTLTMSGEGAGRFTAPIPRQARDGQPHLAQVRVSGHSALLPERPVMLRAGSFGPKVLSRFEHLPGGLVAGFVVLPATPQEIATVSLLRGDETILAVPANLMSPHLRAHGFPDVNRGFQFDVSQLVAGAYTLRIEALGRTIVDHSTLVTHDRESFRFVDAGTGRTGICFVLPDLRTDTLAREEARSILFAAAEVARGNVSITIAVLAGATRSSGDSFRDSVLNLVGETGTDKLSRVEFVRVPDAIIPASVEGRQALAFKLDLWMRANAFSSLIGTSRGGALSYSVISKRQGLAGSTRIVQLVEGFSVGDLLANEYLLDRPDLLTDEALERQATRSVDLNVAFTGAVHGIREVMADPEPSRAFVQIGDAPLSGASTNLVGASRWLVFLGPLRASAGLVVMCDSLDKLSEILWTDEDPIGVAFIGPDDYVRDLPSVDFIRKRARRWPFHLRIWPGLAWDGYRRLVASFRDVFAIHVAVPSLAGGCWDELARAGKLDRVAMMPSPNPADLANRLAAILRAPNRQDCEPPPRVGQSIGKILLERQDLTSVEEVRPSEDADQPLVSVCVTHYNRPILLRQTLNSIASSDYPNIEIVVVDDGSSFEAALNELEAIESWLAQHNGRVVRQPNRYLGAARNAAARAARGKLLVFMDDDNLAFPKMVRMFVECHHRTGADIVTARFFFFESFDTIDMESTTPGVFGVQLPPDLGLGVFINCFGDANMLISRRAFEHIGGFTEDYGSGHEDWELLARANMLGLRQELYQEPLFWYRVSPDGMLRGRERPEVDLQRNIRGYQAELRPEIYRVLQLAQGLAKRAGGRPTLHRMVSEPAFSIGSRLAWGRIAVIMRTRGAPNRLRRAIDSVLDQSFQDWVLVIVSDGGDPLAVESVLDERSVILQGRHLLVDRPGSMTMMDAASLGVRLSDSEFIVVHDDNHSWAPDFLARSVLHLDATPLSVAGTITHATAVLEEASFNNERERSRYPHTSLSEGRLVREGHVPSAAFLLRRSALEAAGTAADGVPGLGDWDFHIRISKGSRVDVIPEPLASVHLRH